jgi:hypothetical protein
MAAAWRYPAWSQHCQNVCEHDLLSLEQLVVYLLPMREKGTRVVDIRAQQDRSLLKIEVDQKLVLITGRAGLKSAVILDQ